MIAGMLPTHPELFGAMLASPVGARLAAKLLAEQGKRMPGIVPIAREASRRALRAGGNQARRAAGRLGMVVGALSSLAPGFVDLLELPESPSANSQALLAGLDRAVRKRADRAQALGARLGDSRPELAPLLARYLASRGSEPTPFWNAAAVAMARSPEFAGRFLQGLSGSSAGREDAVRRLVGGSPTRARVLSFALGRALAVPTQGDPHRADLLGRLIGRRKDLAQAALAGVVGSAHRGSMASTRSDLLWRISIQGLARASERSFAFRELLDEQLLQLAHDPRSMERWARQDPDSVAQSIDRLPSLMLPIIGTEEGRRAARSSPKIVASLLRAAQRIQDSRLARELASPSQSPLQLCLAHAAGATEDLAGGTVSRAVRRFIERPSLHRDLIQEERKGRREATGHWSEEEPREAPARAGARSPAARPRAQRAALPPGLGPGHPGIPPRPASRESARSRRNAPGDTRSNPLLGSRRTDPPLTNDLPVLKRNQQLTAPLGGARQRAAQSRPLAAGRAHSLAARALPGAVPRAPKTTGASLRPTPGITAPRRLARPGGVSGARQPDRMSPGQPLIPRPVQLPGRSTAGGPMAATAQSGGPSGASRSERGSKVQLSTPQLPARPDAQRAVALRDQLVQSNGPGQAIPPAQRAEMEQYFGHRMDNVRLHTGAHVSRAADSLQADAFTIGRDVFFAPGKLAVDTKEGKALLAHELTHVVQQTGMGRRFHGYGNAPQTLEEEARHVERIFRKAPTTGGGALAISRVNLTLENAGAAPVTRDHRERLEAITALALELAQQRLSVDARTPTGRFHLSALDVALEIDLELSDEDSARRLADAICLRLWKHAPEPRPSRAAAPVLPQVQRFESDEHRDIGAKGSGAKRLQLDLGDGTQLTYGEMVALAGDFFESLSEIQTLSRSRAGKEQLRWARWKALYQGSPPPEVSNDARQAVETRYRTLAARNASHFSQGGQAQSNYQSYHQSALRLAFEAGASAGRHEQEGQWEAALLNEAFGNHFLTDMFSSGHVRTPREEISRWYAAQFADSNERLLAHMADAITDNLIAIDQPRWTPRWAIRSKVRSQLDATVGRSFSLGDLVALAWHNADNQGLQVVSEAGPDGVERKGGFRWEAVGDEHLHQPGKAAGTTQQMVVAAVKASLQELEHARAAGRRARGAKGDVAKARQQFLATHSRSAAERLVPHTDERTPNAEMAWKWGHFNEAMHRAFDETLRQSLPAKVEEATQGMEPVSSGFHQVQAIQMLAADLRTRGIAFIEDAMGTPSGFTKGAASTPKPRAIPAPQPKPTPTPAAAKPAAGKPSAAAGTTTRKVTVSRSAAAGARPDGGSEEAAALRASRAFNAASLDPEALVHAATGMVGRLAQYGPRIPMGLLMMGVAVAGVVEAPLLVGGLGLYLAATGAKRFYDEHVRTVEGGMDTLGAAVAPSRKRGIIPAAGPAEQQADTAQSDHAAASNRAERRANAETWVRNHYGAAESGDGLRRRVNAINLSEPVEPVAFPQGRELVQFDHPLLGRVVSTDPAAPGTRLRVRKNQRLELLSVTPVGEDAAPLLLFPPGASTLVESAESVPTAAKARPNDHVGRRNRARGWLQAHSRLSASPDLLESYMRGIDFNHPLRVRTLAPGTRLIQFERLAGVLGIFCAKPGTDPAQLGMSPQGRILREMEVVQEVTVLETTAAPFQSGQVQGVGGGGGARQFIMPPRWEPYVRLTDVPVNEAIQPAEKKGRTKPAKPHEQEARKAAKKTPAPPAKPAEKKPAPPPDPELQVSEGQTTFDAEGSDNPKSLYYSRRASVPTESSGLTIGRGYDMKERDRDEIVEDLTSAGLDPEAAAKYADAGTGYEEEVRPVADEVQALERSLAGLKKALNRKGITSEQKVKLQAEITATTEALTKKRAEWKLKRKQFLAKHPTDDISKVQQQKLFEKVSYPEQRAETARLVKKYYEVDLDTVNPAIRELLVDLKYRGDLRPKQANQAALKKAVKANDVDGVLKAISNSKLYGSSKPDKNRDQSRKKRLAQELNSQREKAAGTRLPDTVPLSPPAHTPQTPPSQLPRDGSDPGEKTPA